MNFVEILKLFQIFEVIINKIHINYELYSKTSNSFIEFVKQNEKIMVDENHLLFWNEKISLSHVVDARLSNYNEAFQFMNFWKLHKQLESKCCKLYFIMYT